MKINELINETTVYDNNKGESIYIEPKKSDGSFYGWTDKYDKVWKNEKELKHWLHKNGFSVVGWE